MKVKRFFPLLVCSVALLGLTQPIAAVWDESTGSQAKHADFNPPVSQVSELPAAATTAVFDVPFLASDAETGVQFVELYYSRDGGAWTQFGTTFLASPISFDSSDAISDLRFGRSPETCLSVSSRYFFMALPPVTDDAPIATASVLSRCFSRSRLFK